MVRKSNQRSGDPDQLSIKEGGTGFTNMKDFRDAYGILGKDDNRVVIINDGKIASGTLVTDKTPSVLLNGVLEGLRGQTTTATIINYDTYTNYSVSIDNGTVTRTGKNISVVIPMSGQATLNINGSLFAISITEVSIGKPIITGNTSRVQDALVTNITISDYSSVQGTPWKSTVLEISANSNFSGYVESIYLTGANRTAYSHSSVTTEDRYFRVIHTDEFDNKSEYSTVYYLNHLSYASPISTPELTTIDRYVSNIGTVINLKSSSYNADAANTYLRTDWQVSTSPDFSIIVADNSTIDGNCFDDYFDARAGDQNVGTLYARVRYRSATSVSEWSATSTIPVSTKTIYPYAEVQRLKHPGGDTQGFVGTDLAISHNSKWVTYTVDNTVKSVFILKIVNGLVEYDSVVTPTNPGSVLRYCNGFMANSGNLLFVAYTTTTDSVMEKFVEVHERVNGAWTLKGSRVKINTDDSITGGNLRIKCSTSGKYIVVSNGLSRNPETAVFMKYDSTNGLSIVQRVVSSKASTNGFGTSTAMSYDGKYIALSCVYEGPVGRSGDPGFIDIYKMNASGTGWDLSMTINDPIQNDTCLFGESISINHDFSKLAVTCSDAYSSGRGIYVYSIDFVNNSATISTNYIHETEIVYGGVTMSPFGDYILATPQHSTVNILSFDQAGNLSLRNIIPNMSFNTYYQLPAIINNSKGFVMGHLGENPVRYIVTVAPNPA